MKDLQEPKKEPFSGYHKKIERLIRERDDACEARDISKRLFDELVQWQGKMKCLCPSPLAAQLAHEQQPFAWCIDSENSADWCFAKTEADVKLNSELMDEDCIKTKPFPVYNTPPAALMPEPAAWTWDTVAARAGCYEAHFQLAKPEKTATMFNLRPLYFKAFKEWAADEGYDVACTHDGIKWVCLNPMAGDLWKAWQAATPTAALVHQIKEKNA
jgi:hypothetical protein